MTKLEIMTLYESNNDRNGYTDADKAKLDGINTSAYCTKAVYDPNARAADCFNSANTDYDNAISGLGATKVKGALDALKALCDGLVAGGSTGNLQYKNSAGKLSGFATYDDSVKTLDLAGVALLNARTKTAASATISGSYTLSNPDANTSYNFTVGAALTAFNIGQMSVSGSQLTTPDHTLKVLFVNAGGYAITAGATIKWLNNVTPDFAIVGNHLCTFTQDPRSATIWIGQYNGTVA